jgi:aromatic ring-opening dioxygenase catalytic subunit (LigB family)
MSERIGFYPNKPREESAQFDSWLRKTLTDFSSRQRSQYLLNWERAPFARAVHPQEDHLVPLHVVVGAAEDEPAHLIYAQDDFFGKITMSSYRLGN